MDSPTDRTVAHFYGLWPALAGIAFGAGLIALMFSLADGFS